MKTYLTYFLPCVACAFLPGTAAAQVSTDFRAWAPTPPMGWNSWDSLCSMANEDEMKRNADITCDQITDGKVECAWLRDNCQSGGPEDAPRGVPQERGGADGNDEVSRPND